MTRIHAETQDGKRIIFNAKIRIPLRIGAYGILSKNGKILMTKSYLPFWEFPGGGVEENESLLDALIREFREETGLVIKPVSLITVRESFYSSPTGKVFHSFQYFFRVAANKGTKSKSVNDQSWVDINKLTKANMKKSAHDALLSYLKGSKEGFRFISSAKNPLRSI